MADDSKFDPSAAAAPVHRLNLNLLYPLEAILHAPTLTEAGRRVRLSQSAMSHALRRLRDHFGDDLVTHTGGDQQVTPLGLALRGEVRRVMREVEGTFNYAVAFDPLTTTGTITIAASESVEQMLLGPMVRLLSTEAPGLSMSIIPLDVDLPQRSLDMGADLLLLPAEATIERLDTRPILTDHVSCMVWNRHSVIGDRDEIDEALYRASHHIVAHGERPSTLAIDAHGAALLNARRICARTTSQAILPGIIIGSDLVATGSSWLFQSYASGRPLKVIPAPFATKSRPIVLQWASHRRRDPMLAWFADRITTFTTAWAHLPGM